MKQINWLKIQLQVSALCLMLVVSSASAVVPSQVQADEAGPFQASSLQTRLQRHDVEFDGLLMIDVTQARGIYADGSPVSEAGVRRARLGVSGDIGAQLSAEIAVDMDLEQSAGSLHEAVLQYGLTEDFAVRAGLMKQPFGLEGSASSKNLQTLERSMASEAFLPERGVGIGLSHESSSHYLSAGTFRNQDDEVQDMTACAVWAPLDRKRQVVHLGVAANIRDNASAEYRVRNSGSIASGENFLKSARFKPTGVNTFGLESAWSQGSLLLQAEWFLQTLKISAAASAEQPVFSGARLQAAWVFDKGYRKYDSGRFGRITDTQSPHAVELVAGFSTVDVRYEESGDQAQEWTLGLNYQLTRNLRMAGQYQSVSALEDKQSLKSGHGLLLRLVATL